MGLTARSWNYTRLDRWQTVNASMIGTEPKKHSGAVATAGPYLPPEVARRLLVTDKIPNR